EIRNARIDDGLPMTEHPVIESKRVYRDRLKEAMKLLNEAAHDVQEREANAWAKADRMRAVQHILNAEKAVKDAMADRKEDKKEEKMEKKEEKKEEKMEQKMEKKDEKMEKKDDKKDAKNKK